MIPSIIVALVVGTVLLSSFIPAEMAVARDGLLNQLISALCLLGWITESCTNRKSKSRKWALCIMFGFCIWTAASRPFVKMNDNFVMIEAIVFACCVVVALWSGRRANGNKTS